MLPGCHWCHWWWDGLGKGSPRQQEAQTRWLRRALLALGTLAARQPLGAAGEICSPVFRKLRPRAEQGVQGCAGAKLCSQNGFTLLKLIVCLQ